MTYIKALEQFISNNQLFLTVLLCGSYFLKRLVDYLAARPQTDAWDSIKPGSPTEGSIYFNSTDKHFYGWNGTAWKQLDN